MKEDDVELMDEFDGEIKAKDAVGRDDVIIHFLIPLYRADGKVSQQKGAGTRRYGRARRYMVRKKILKVRVVGFPRLLNVDEKHCICAYVGEYGDRDKLRVVWE
jgi:hypothetical protein